MDFEVEFTINRGDTIGLVVSTDERDDRELVSVLIDLGLSSKEVAGLLVTRGAEFGEGVVAREVWELGLCKKGFRVIGDKEQDDTKAKKSRENFQSHFPFGFSFSTKGCLSDDDDDDV